MLSNRFLYFYFDLREKKIGRDKPNESERREEREKAREREREKLRELVTKLNFGNSMYIKFTTLLETFSFYTILIKS